VCLISCLGTMNAPRQARS